LLNLLGRLLLLVVFARILNPTSGQVLYSFQDEIVSKFHYRVLLFFEKSDPARPKVDWFSPLFEVFDRGEIQLVANVVVYYLESSPDFFRILIVINRNYLYEVSHSSMEVKESNVNLRLATWSRPSQALKQPKLPASASERRYVLAHHNSRARSSQYNTVDWCIYRAAGSQGAAGRLKLRVERRPLLALEAVMFGVDFTGPYILGVIFVNKFYIAR
jgi:hypothetical protein